MANYFGEVPDYLTLAPTDSTIVNTVDFVTIVMRYLTWCKLYGHNTTMLDTAPVFDMLQIKDIVNFSNKSVDSLRVRGYHKIWNDYFRQVNLTSEIPVPYADNGDDLLNYYNAVDNYLDSNNFNQLCECLEISDEDIDLSSNEIAERIKVAVGFGDLSVYPYLTRLSAVRSSAKLPVASCVLNPGTLVL